MTKLTATIVLGLLLGGCKTAEPRVISPPAKAFVESMRDDSVMTMTNGVVDIVVSVRTGRISYFGFTERGANLLWADPSAEDAKPGDWQNWGGDKVWIWPQSEYPNRGPGWPPPGDPPGAPYEVVKDGEHTLTMTSPVIGAYGVRLVRRIALQPGRPVMTVTNRFRVVDETKVEGLGLWNVTQVPAVDEVVARPNYRRSPLGLLGETYPKPMNDATPPWPPPQPSLTAPGEVIFKRPKTGNAKVGVDSNLLRVRLGDTFLTQTAAAWPMEGKFDPNERAHLYTDPGSFKPGPYLELEFVTPEWSVEDVKRGTLTITWTLWRPEK